MNEGSRAAIVAAFLANLGIAVAKLVAFAFTGAASMLAESVHSLADTGNQGLLMLGGHRAKQAADEAHPFGFGRERYFWAFVVVVVLFTLGSGFAMREGIDKLLHPHEIDSPWWAVGTLLIAIGVESFSFRTAIRESGHVRGNRSLVRFIRTSKAPELPVVLLEDFGALIGLFLALVGIGLATLTDNSRFDALGSLGIGILLGCIAVVLAVRMKSLLIGEAAGDDEIAAIRESVERGEHVRCLYGLRTEHLGPEELLVAGKVEFDRHLSFPEIAREIDLAEERVRARVPTARLIYLEPDVFDPDHDRRRSGREDPA